MQGLPAVVAVVRDGFGWWAGELADLLPAGLRRGGAATQPDAVVTMEAGGFSLLRDGARPRGGRSNSKPGIEPESDVWTALSRLARANAGAAVGLRLPASACFVRKVDIPAAARRDANRILALDLERATPFQPRDVYAAHYFEAGPAQNGMLKAVQVIAKREAVDKAVAELEAAGVTVARVDCWDSAGTSPLPVNLLEGAAGRTGAGASPLWMKLLAGMALALALAAPLIVLGRYESALAALDAEVAEARGRAGDIARAAGGSDAAFAEQARVADLKASRAPVAAILEALSKVLPDSAWLTSLAISGETIDLSGFAKPAAALIPLLEQSPLVAEAAFSAPVTLDEAEGKERFDLRLRLRAAPGPAGVPANGEATP